MLETKDSINTVLMKLDKYFIKIKLAKAKELARNGSLKQAELLLSELINSFGNNVLCLDLQARIYTQQGRVYEAETIWRNALQMEPTNSLFKVALDRIAKIQRYPFWFIPILHLIMGFILIIFLLVGSNYLLNNSRDNIEKQITSISSANINNNELIIDKLVKFENTFLNSNKSIPNKLQLNFELNIPGITKTAVNNELILLFDEGIFESGIILKQEKKELLTLLGKQLEPITDRIYVKIFGITNNIPMRKGRIYKDNIDLGKARANVVFDHFRTETKILPGKMLIGSYGESLPPFPNNSAGKSQNKSVIIKISMTE